MAFAITATKTTKNANSSTSVHSSVQGYAQSVRFKPFQSIIPLQDITNCVMIYVEQIINLLSLNYHDKLTINDLRVALALFRENDSAKLRFYTAVKKAKYPVKKYLFLPDLIDVPTIAKNNGINETSFINSLKKLIKYDLVVIKNIRGQDKIIFRKEKINLPLPFQDNDILASSNNRATLLTKEQIEELIKSSSRSEILLTLAYALRGIRINEGQVKCSGAVKTSLLATLCNTSERQVTRTRQSLINREWISKDNTKFQTKLNKTGHYFVFNLALSNNYLEKINCLNYVNKNSSENNSSPQTKRAYVKRKKLSQKKIKKVYEILESNLSSAVCKKDTFFSDVTFINSQNVSKNTLNTSKTIDTPPVDNLKKIDVFVTPPPKIPPKNHDFCHPYIDTSILDRSKRHSKQSTLNTLNVADAISENKKLTNNQNNYKSSLPKPSFDIDPKLYEQKYLPRNPNLIIDEDFKKSSSKLYNSIRQQAKLNQDSKKETKEDINLQTIREQREAVKREIFENLDHHRDIIRKNSFNLHRLNEEKNSYQPTSSANGISSSNESSYNGFQKIDCDYKQAFNKYGVRRIDISEFYSPQKLENLYWELVSSNVISHSEAEVVSFCALVEKVKQYNHFANPCGLFVSEIRKSLCSRFISGLWEQKGLTLLHKIRSTNPNFLR